MVTNKCTKCNPEPCKCHPCYDVAIGDCAATPIDPCVNTEYCNDGCVEIISSDCIMTPCGTLTEVLAILFPNCAFPPIVPPVECPDTLVVSTTFTNPTFNINLSTSELEEADSYVAIFKLPNGTVLASIEFTESDIANPTTISNTNWASVSPYLSSQVISNTNLNTGINITFDKEGWATANGYLYNTRLSNNATDLIFEFGLKKAECTTITQETTLNRVVAVFGTPTVNNYANFATDPGVINYAIAGTEPFEYNISTLNLTEIYPNNIGKLFTQIQTSPSQYRYAYMVEGFASNPTKVNRYAFFNTNQYGHFHMHEGYEIAGYDFETQCSVASFTRQLENTTNQYNITLLYRAEFQELLWDKTNIVTKARTTTLNSVATTDTPVFNDAGTSPVATHKYDTTQITTLPVGVHTMEIMQECDSKTRNNNGDLVTQTFLSKTMIELELNYLY